MKLNPTQFEPQRERLFDPEPYAGIGARPGEVKDQYRDDDEAIVEERYTGRLLHRSSRDFEPGALVLPVAMRGNKPSDTNFPGLSSRDHAYAFRESRRRTFTKAGVAEEDSSDATFSGFLGRNVYEVEPITQDFSVDPNWTSADAIRSNKGFRVVGKVDS